MYNNFQQNPYLPYGYQQKTNYNMPNYGAVTSPYGSIEARLPQNYLKCRPVSSIEEVRAAQVDLDGSLFVFPDIANQKIYTKQINPDGTASLNVYTLQIEEPKTEPRYITREELEKTLAAFKATLDQTENKIAIQSQPTVSKPKFNL